MAKRCEACKFGLQCTWFSRLSSSFQGFKLFSWYKMLKCQRLAKVTQLLGTALLRTPGAEAHGAGYARQYHFELIRNPWAGNSHWTRLHGTSAALVAAALASLTAVTVSWCDGETPLQRVQLEMLRQWLSENGGDVSGVEFRSVEVRDGLRLEAAMDRGMDKTECSPKL
jgi:hypothetical protein